MFSMIQTVLQNKKGQGMVEYGLILALVAVVGMAGLVPSARRRQCRCGHEKRDEKNDGTHRAPFPLPPHSRGSRKRAD